MSAWPAIVRLEAIRVLRDRAMLVMVVLFTLLAGYATFAGDRWAQYRASAVQQVIAEADETMALRREAFVKLVAKGEKPNFGLIYATALPFRAGLPNAPLAALSAGQAEGYASAAAISPFADPFAIFDRYTTGLESPTVLTAGRFDLAFVIVMLLPLLLIAATYDFWSRDVENGSARIQLAQPVRPAALILTRAAMRGGTLLAAVTAIASLLLASTGNDPVGIAWFALVVLAYGAFWIALATLINLFVRTSTAAALACGTAWLALVVLLPAGLAALVDIAAPPPSVRAHANAVRTVGLEVRAAHAEAARAAATAESVRAYPASLWHSRREIGVRDARLAPLYRDHAAAWEQHRALASAVQIFSPAVLAQDALDRIAGTDATRALAFQQQARAFAGAVRQLAFDWMDADRLLTLADYDGGLPRFIFVEPPRGAAIAADLAIMLLLSALLLALAALRLRRGAQALF
jgi:ABC-2 type transport system permease protein